MASAFCNVRAKLDEVVFKQLQVQILQQAKQDPNILWHEHRLLAVDGSKMNLPRQLIRAGYKTPSDIAHYPQGTVSCLYELKSKIPIGFDLAKQGDERAMTLSHLNSLSEIDVVVYERGYYSYNMLHEHMKRRIHPVFRLKKTACGVVEAFVNSDDIDAVVQIVPSQINACVSIYSRAETRLSCTCAALSEIRCWGNNLHLGHHIVGSRKIQY